MFVTLSALTLKAAPPAPLAYAQRHAQTPAFF